MIFLHCNKNCTYVALFHPQSNLLRLSYYPLDREGKQGSRRIRSCLRSHGVGKCPHLATQAASFSQLRRRRDCSSIDEHRGAEKLVGRTQVWHF